jgi:hypothetical protein
LVNITTWSIYAFSVVGTLPLFYYLDSYSYNIGIQSKEEILKVLLYSSINLVSFLFGVLSVRRGIKLTPIPIISSDIKPLKFKQKLFSLMTFLFCVFVLVVYIKQIDKIAFFVALTDGFRESKVVRSEMGSSFSGAYHWYSLVMHDIGNLITYIFFASWLLKKNLLSFFLFLITLLYSIFTAIMATEKAPLAWLIIGLIIVYYLVRRSGVLSVKKIFYLVAGVLIALVLLYIFFMGADNIFEAFGLILSRAFSGSIAPAYFYIQFFPEHHDYLLGQTFPNPGGVLPYETFRYTREVSNWVFPNLADKGIVGSMPTVFWGESFVNFGPIAIPLIGYLTGSITAISSYIISKFEINPISIGFIVSFILVFKNLSVTGFSGFIVNFSLISVTLFLIFALSLYGYITIRVRGKKLNTSNY